MATRTWVAAKWRLWEKTERYSPAGEARLASPADCIGNGRHHQEPTCRDTLPTWGHEGSNPEPSRCKQDALPILAPTCRFSQVGVWGLPQSYDPRNDPSEYLSLQRGRLARRADSIQSNSKT